jgi:hypothetical protein
MTKEEKANVIHGLVNCNGQWQPIDKKVAFEQDRRRKIEKGLVFCQGEWITIDEKIRRVVPKTPPAQKPAGPQQVTINKNVYNVQYHTDNRQIQETSHEHKHVHVDSQELAKRIQQDADQVIGSDERVGLEGGRGYASLKGKKPIQIEGQEQKKLPGKNKAALPPPDEDKSETQ